MIAAALAAVLSLAFATVVGRRFAASRRPAFGAWTAGFLIFAAAAAVQAIGQYGGFTPLLFRLFYLLGGVLGVIYLALGTFYLHAPRRLAHICAVVLVVLTVVVAIDAFLVPVDAARLTDAKGVLGEAYTSTATPIHLGAVLFNIIGTLVLVGGSAWSAWRFARDRAGIDRVVCNVLLTAGALLIAAGFSAAKVGGAPSGSLTVLGVCEAVGIAIMFAGFLSLGRLGRASTRGSTLGAAGPAAASGPPQP